MTVDSERARELGKRSGETRCSTSGRWSGSRTQPPGAGLGHYCVASLLMPEVAGLLYEGRGQSVVLRDSLAVLIHVAEAVAAKRGLRIARHLIEAGSTRVVLRQALTIVVQGTEVHTACGLASNAGSLEEGNGAGVILRYSAARIVQATEAGACRIFAIPARHLKEAGGTSIVLRHTLTKPVQDAEVSASHWFHAVARFPDPVSFRLTANGCNRANNNAQLGEGTHRYLQAGLPPNLRPVPREN